MAARTKVSAPIDINKTNLYIFLMFGFSASHLFILIIVLLFFGPKRLPELGRTLGKALRDFKDTMGGMQEGQARPFSDTNNSQQHQSLPQAQQLHNNKNENPHQVSDSQDSQNLQDSKDLQNSLDAQNPELSSSENKIPGTIARK